jgi:phosphoglycerol transferase MdoB-like AlkP superfamily enzyme
MQLSVDDYINNQPFHVYFLTVSGHLEYNFGGNMMAYNHKEEVKDLPYSEAPRAYIACQMETDRALKYLLSRLEEAGIADKTLIVMGSDHYPYGLENEEISEFLGHPVEPVFELQKNSLIMYVAGMQPETVDKPCSSMDILPTVSNLMGLAYDSRLLMGRDIFSDAPPLVIFQDKSFITDKGSYNRAAKKFTAFGDDVPDDYQAQVSAQIDVEFTVSAKILELDYYRKLFETE